MLAILAQLRSSEGLDPSELRQLQFLQVAEIMRHTDRCVPHYGASLYRAGFRPDRPLDEETWSRIPILTRRDAQDAGPRLHATELPKGHGRVSEQASSGSSGKPVRIRRSELGHFYWQAFEPRGHLWHGRDPGAYLLGLRRDRERTDFPGKVHLRRNREWGPPVSTVYRAGPSAIPDHRTPIPLLAEAIVTEAPGHLLTCPSLLLEILRHHRESGVRPEGLRGVLSIGEAVSGELRELCRSV